MPDTIKPSSDDMRNGVDERVQRHAEPGWDLPRDAVGFREGDCVTVIGELDAAPTRRWH